MEDFFPVLPRCQLDAFRTKTNIFIGLAPLSSYFLFFSYGFSMHVVQLPVDVKGIRRSFDLHLLIPDCWTGCLTTYSDRTFFSFFFFLFLGLVGSSQAMYCLVRHSLNSLTFIDLSD